MSLVGPRPPIPYEVELYEPWQLERLAVMPGLTGLWQANGWGRLSFEEGVRLDLEYVRRRSFWLDVRIIVAHDLADRHRSPVLGTSDRSRRRAVERCYPGTSPADRARRASPSPRGLPLRLGISR